MGTLWNKLYLCFMKVVMVNTQREQCPSMLKGEVPDSGGHVCVFCCNDNHSGMCCCNDNYVVMCHNVWCENTMTVKRGRALLYRPNCLQRLVICKHTMGRKARLVWEQWHCKTYDRGRKACLLWYKFGLITMSMQRGEGLLLYTLRVYIDSTIEMPES